jgi:nicotinate-nucleotide adenylyltransferase
MIRNVLGILGGTFDPIHFGHLRLGIEAMDALGLSVVRIIPAGVPPHRAPPAASAQARLDMVRLAVAAEPRFMIDESEATSPAPSYTVDTLARLRGELGNDPSLCLLLGADAFAGLAAWSRWRQLFELAHLGVASHAGRPFDASALPAELAEEYSARRCDSAPALRNAPCGRIVNFAMSEIDISASSIRQKIARGESPDDLLPNAVLDYIDTNHLYRKELDGR